ncbi:tetratricopeptide repeat protein [Aquicoccus porphyridii]|uniref:Tetratricopeptide repeat protein n=2 Tax=Aquicoccus porphyridii TaxID=1852029 RepID=A0A5A9ZG85_9RHOB|nr:tetratricopeptide repeat protein [Aquicoccus porphyridii]
MSTSTMKHQEKAFSPLMAGETESDTLNGVPQASDSHRLVLHPGARQLLVLISATGTKPGRFNLWKYADILPCHKLYLRAPTNDWYQQGVPGLGADFKETAENIRRLAAGCRAEKIYTCGSSMGGYGAILFGLELDASVLAFSPEIVLKLPFSRSYKMMPEGVQMTAPDLRQKLAAAQSPVVIYTGEMDPVDLYCAATVRNLPSVQIVTFRDDEHTVMRTLFQTDRLETTLREFVEDKPLPTIMEKGSALDIAGYPRSFYRGWQYFLKKEDDLAIKELRKAIAAYPISARANFFMAKLMLRNSNPEKAREHAAMAVAMTPNFVEHRVFFAHCLRMTGALEGAMYNHMKILETWPDTPQSHFDLGQIYFQKGQIEKARLQFSEAVRLEPSNPAYVKKLEKLNKLYLSMPR